MNNFWKTQAKEDIALHHWRIYAIILCAGIGGILYGYDIGVISGALLFINRSIPMSDLQLGLIVGAVLGGGFLANLVTGSLADHFGRRPLILLASGIFILGIIAILFATTFFSLFCARLLLGIGVGIISVAIPLYISEVAPTALRGIGVTVFQLFLTFGIVLAYFIDMLFTSSGNWRGMFSIIVLPASLLFFTMLFLPESPRWLLSKGKNILAEKILKKIRPQFSVAGEINEIQASLHDTPSNWSELFSKKLALPLTIALFIAASNQLTGINAIFQYAPLVIKQAGFHNHTTLMQATVLIGLVNFITSIVALFLIERLGRRFLLILGTSLLVLADLSLGFLAQYHLPIANIGMWQLIGLMIWTFAFAIGPGVVVWLVFAELLPTRVRGRGVALCLFVNSLCSAILSSVFLPLMASIGMGKTFWLLGFFTFFYFLAAVFLLPETKGKSLEEIQAFFQKKTDYWVASAE